MTHHGPERRVRQTPRCCGSADGTKSCYLRYDAREHSEDQRRPVRDEARALGGGHGPAATDECEWHTVAKSHVNTITELRKRLSAALAAGVVTEAPQRQTCPKCGSLFTEPEVKP